MKTEPEVPAVEIVPYAPEFREAFRALNVAWITKHFRMEAEDFAVLDHPEEHILAPGGRIFVALAAGKAVGVCALLKKPAGSFCDFELAKLAVAPKARGHGVGRALCERVVEAARELGGGKIYLEGNTKLAPSIRLYRSLGFREIPFRDAEFSRCDVQMTLDVPAAF